ncbi:hypothetical protein WN944_026658 [Citrus x changshan-huyou]|uniref:Uncharacterized protein n=1 Tax=Citrus x changshan-huyou TaxID=2935761 RepID=A0AAP0LVH1_9ROSI
MLLLLLLSANFSAPGKRISLLLLIQAAPEVHGWYFLDQFKKFSILSPCKTIPAEQNSPQATMDAPIPALPDLCSFLNAFPAA